MRLLNAVSLSMFSAITTAFSIRVEPLSVEQARALFITNGLVSCVGHEQAAAIASSLLGMEVPLNRVTTKLEEGEQAVVLQYQGPRLPEGAITLPEGAEMQFFRICAAQ